MMLTKGAQKAHGAPTKGGPKKGHCPPTKGGPKKAQDPLMKGGPKNAQGSQIADPPPSYENVRLKQMMRNNARLQQLGLSAMTSMFANTAATSQQKNKTKHINREDSGSEYDPLQDDAIEGDLSDDHGEEGSKGQTCKSNNTQTLDAPSTTGIKFQSRKRVYAHALPTGGPRSKRINSQPDASMTPSTIPVPPGGNFEDHIQPAGEDVEGVAIPHSDGHNHLSSEDVGGDAIPRSDGHNHLSSEDGVDHHDENNTMVDEAVGITHPTGDNHMTNKGRRRGLNRGVNMGYGLERMSRARQGKLAIVINEGNIRPLVPLVAAKYATECNIVVRNHVPILTHWKEYKKHPAIIDFFMGRLRAKFDIDTDDTIVRNGCLEMMKSAVRQQRHRLKQKFFDPFPLHLVRRTSPVKATSDERWIALVESWKTPKKMETCQINKENRGNVKFPQTTGSCSYPVFVENLVDKDEDEEPDALHLFKACHFSKKKKGYTPNVQLAIDEMENQLSTPTEGELPKSATEVVAAVLDNNTKSNHFLQNVGIQIARPRSREQIVDAELQAEKMVNAELRSQMDDMSKKLQETEHARIRDQEEMKMKHAELEAKLERLLGQSSR